MKRMMWGEGKDGGEGGRGRRGRWRVEGGEEDIMRNRR
jgi:hypothetical protein